MSEMKLDLDRDLSEARDMVDGLVEYVRGDQLYGSIGGLFGSGNKPALTVGALLLRLRRLRALHDRLSESQRARLASTEAAHDKARTEWKRHYDEKLLREANSRLDAMRTWFEECSNNPRACAANYLPEALRRTIVQEIVVAMEQYGIASQSLMEKLRGTDSRLRRYAQTTDFIWAAELASVYPKDPFWWLYARPPQPEGK
jgi:hypothetical protein